MGRTAKYLRHHAVPLVFAIVLCVALAAALWIGLRASAARTHLERAQSLVSEVAPASFADAAALDSTLEEVRTHTRDARELTSDPIWLLATGVPWVGPQLAAVSTATDAVDDIVGALDPFATAVSMVGLDAFAPSSGVVDTAAFQQLHGPAATAAAASADAATSLSAVDRTQLLPPVREAIDQAASLADLAADSTDALSRATALLPAMLGADGPRDYLLLFQNNAEWRSLGGLAGSVALLHTESGRFSLTAQTSGGSLGTRTEPPLPFSDEVLGIYGTRPGRYPANVTQLADFTLAAPLTKEFWRQKYGQDVDGVVAIDPVTLSYLLEVVGSVALPGNEVIDAGNAVQLLLNDVYLRYDDPRQQDAFFGEATAAVFEAVSARPLNPVALLTALGRASEENRLFIWSADSQEQAVLDGSSLQGTLPVTDRDTTRFGVYVNDGTGSKMDYYMRLDTQVAWCEEKADGTARVRLRVTLRDDAPADVAGYTRHITGAGNYGVPAGSTKTVTYVYLPTGAEPVATATSSSEGIGGGLHAGRLVYSWTSILTPGRTATFDVDVIVPTTENLEVVRTATLGSTVDEASAPTLCDAGMG